MEVPGDTHYVFVCQGKNCLTKGSAELLGQIRTALGGQQTFKVVPLYAWRPVLPRQTLPSSGSPVVLDGNAGAASLRDPVHSKG